MVDKTQILETIKHGGASNSYLYSYNNRVLDFCMILKFWSVIIIGFVRDIYGIIFDGNSCTNDNEN